MIEREGTHPPTFPGKAHCRRRGRGLLYPVAIAFLSYTSQSWSAQTLIDAGQNWRYAKGTGEASSPVEAWRGINFNDSSWLIGRSGIGYGGGDDLTVLADMPGNYLSVFLRRTFSLSSRNGIQSLQFVMDYDDGFVAYLNGTEIARRGLEGDPVPFDARAATHPPGVPESFEVSASLLVTGKNVLAIQVHNDSLLSDGLTAIPRLLATPVMSVTRGPYLQLGGPTAQTVVWQTSVPSDGVLEYGPTPALGLVTSEDGPPRLTHVVTLSGLAPESLYHYRLAGNGQVLAQGFSFRTFPAPGSPAPLRLTAWGDSGTGDQNQLYVGGLIQALAPDLAIHTGDIVYDAGQAENFNARYFTPYRSLISRINVFTTLGNHDTFTSNGQPYLDAFYLPSNNPAGTERYYSFDYGNVHFVSLDTNSPVGPGSPQRAWLERDLATMGGFWTIAFHHHTPYTTTHEHAGDPQNAAIRSYLSPLYDLYGVDLVVVGHAHCYERTYPIRKNAVLTKELSRYQDLKGPIYVTTGGGGRDLYGQDFSSPNNAFLARFRSEFHAVALDFSDAGLEVRALRFDNTLLDSFQLAKRPDTTAPAISEVAAVDLSETGARIIWETDEVADSMVEYGPGPAPVGDSSDEPRLLSHSVGLSGLSPGVEYHYRVRSRDRAGNEAAGDVRTFFTAGVPLEPWTVAYWRWEGNPFDVAVGARHAVVSGARYSIEVPAAAVPQTGSPNVRSLSLDGSVRVALPDPDFRLVDWAEATIECFFRARGPLTDQILLSQGRPGNGADPGTGVWIMITAAGALELRQANPAGPDFLLATEEGAVVPDRWYHLAFTLEGGTAMLYLDGVGRATGRPGAIDRSGWTEELLVGSAAWGGGETRPFLGQLDELRISDRPLPPGRFLLADLGLRLELAAPETADRSDPFAVHLLGASNLPFSGFRSVIRFDPALVEFIGSREDAFSGTPWDEGEVRADGPGRIRVAASRAAAGEAPARFATLRFRARACTGSAAFDLDPREAFLVLEEPEKVEESPRLAGGATTIETGPTFVRGDADGAQPIDPRDPASAVGLSDGIFLLQFLYVGGAEPPCLEAADVNADGRLTLGDPVLLLLFLFGDSGPVAIPPPWPQVGRAAEPHFSCERPPPSAACQ